MLSQTYIGIAPMLNLASIEDTLDAIVHAEPLSWALVSALALIITLVGPLVIAMIFKSERKQAKFSYFYTKAQQDFVEVQVEKAEECNNFKLISCKGYVNVEKPLVDELFGIRIQNAVKIQRTVEMI